MVVTDGVHLMSDGPMEELHTFAQAMGLKRHWFQDHPVHPHYDLTTTRALRRAIDKGAVLVTPHELVAIYRRSVGSKQRGASGRIG